MLPRHWRHTLSALHSRAVQRLESDLHDLRYLFLECTRRCNLRCRHCGSDCGRDDGLPGLPCATLLHALGRVADTWAAGGIMVVVTGGEPLVRPDLFELLTGIRRLGFRLGLVTNGVALDARRAQRLGALGAEAVTVSLDGPQDSHDWLRARRGAFAAARDALGHLRRAGVPVVEAITCVTPRSLERLDETLEIVLQAGTTHWRIFNIFPAGRAVGDRTLLLEGSELAELVARVAALRERGAERGLVVNLSEEGFLGWEWERRVRDAPYFCRAGINIAGVMADGALAACPNLPRWMHQGNLLRDDLVTAWQTRYALFRDRSWTRQGRCATCAQWPCCQGSSLHLWDTKEGGPCWCHHALLHPSADGSA